MVYLKSSFGMLWTQRMLFPMPSLLRKKGNSMFEDGHFSVALEIYHRAIHCLCFVAPDLGESVEPFKLFKDLVIVLHLNVAVCAIKLCKFGMAIEFCSLVLGVDDRNVKALFRRGLALAKSGKVKEAIADLEKAHSFDPKNKMIRDELSALRMPSCVQLNQDVLESQFESCQEGVGFSNKDGVKGISRSAPPKLSDEVEQITCVKEEVLSDVRVHELQPKVYEDDVQAMVVEDLVDVHHTPNELGSSNLFDQAPVSIKSPSPPSPPISSNDKVLFINRRRKDLSLKVARDDLVRLSQGKSIYFFPPNSMSFLEIRISNLKISIQMETPLEIPSREAVVPDPLRTPCEMDLGSSLSKPLYEEVDHLRPYKKELLLFSGFGIAMAKDKATKAAIKRALRIARANKFCSISKDANVRSARKKAQAGKVKLLPHSPSAGLVRSSKALMRKCVRLGVKRKVEDDEVQVADSPPKKKFSNSISFQDTPPSVKSLSLVLESSICFGSSVNFESSFKSCMLIQPAHELVGLALSKAG